MSLELNATRPLPVMKAPALKPGDRVGLISPASRPSSPGALHRCVQVVEQMGLVPVVGPHAMMVHGHLAGTDDERLSDVNDFIIDDSIRGIFCTTGGFGSLHLLPNLPYESLLQSPKVIVGGDDNTSLINAITTKTGLVTFHGPNLDQVVSQSTFHKLTSTLMSSGIQQPMQYTSADDMDWRCYSPVPGKVEGRLSGGNLTAFVSLLGTPFEPSKDGALLFFEDKNEQNGILDRWITTLYLNGFLQSANGVFFGAFENCGRIHAVNMLSIEDLFGDRLTALNKVCCFGMPFGQTKNTTVIPLGIKASLDTQAGLLEYFEPALSN